MSVKPFTRRAMEAMRQSLDVVSAYKHEYVGIERPLLVPTRPGTSTSFCIAQAITDVQCMLAFLGCFMPMIRDDWRLPSAVGNKKRGWLRRLLDSD